MDVHRSMLDFFRNCISKIVRFWNMSGIVGIIIFIPVLIIRPQSFGIGAVFNMIGSGYIVDLYLWLFGKINIAVETLELILLIRV